MATKTLKGKFLPQYRTAAQWSAADSVLLRGEIGVESDTRKFKFGDGTTSWNNLGYAQSGTTGGSGEAATYEPVEISEYGAIYDLTSLNEVPAGAIVTWYANGSVVDGDYGPFGGMAERVDGIYIAIKGSEDDTYRQGILLAFRTDGEEKSMAYAHISGGPGVGGVASAGDWAVYTPGGSSESGSGRTVVASGITWDGVQYKNVTVPMRAFSNQPNYIIRGYVGNANAAYAFSCETCGCLLSDGINFIASGIVKRSLTANTSLVVTANYVDPTEDNNPYREAAFDTLSIRLTDSSSDTTVVITEIIEEITTGGGTDVREVIIDVHACGVEAGENIELMFELTTSWLGWFDVLDDLTVRVSFNELSSMIGQELTDHVGERFYIEASDNGECWFGPIPASGNIEAELV